MSDGWMDSVIEHLNFRKKMLGPDATLTEIFNPPPPRLPLSKNTLLLTEMIQSYALLTCSHRDLERDGRIDEANKVQDNLDKLKDMMVDMIEMRRAF